MADYDDIIVAYNSAHASDGAELEIRYHFTKEEYALEEEKIFSNCKNFSSEMSFTAHNDRKRIEVYFQDKKKTEEKYVEKLVIKELKTKKYKISVATEKPCQKFGMSDTTHIRFKNRKSCVIGDWRYDLTIIDELHKDEYKSLKHAIQGFLNGTLVTPYRKYEFEIEFMKKSVTLQDLKEIIKEDNIFNQLVGYFKPYLKSRVPSTIKDITNNPIVISAHDYNIEVFPRIQEYYITNKADGIRAIVLIKDQKMIILTDAKIITSATNMSGTFIFDAELINDVPHCFDILLHNNKSLFDFPFSQRLNYLEEMFSTNISPLLMKKQVRINNYKEDIQGLLNTDYGYENDGIIFTHMDAKYYDKVYKWKPPKNNTIDFLLRKIPDAELGKIPYNSRENFTLYLLFVYVNVGQFSTLSLRQLPFYSKLFEVKGSDYFPTHFCPSLKPDAYIFYSLEADLDQKICEMYFKNGEWHKIRDRIDRQIPNNFKIAELSFMGYYNPFTEDKLIIPSGYFTAVKTDRYKAINKFNRFVSWNAFKYLANSILVFDLASGRGADMTLFSSHHVKNLVLVEKDSDAMEEAITRKYSLHDKRKYVYQYDPSHKMSVYAQILDLSDFEGAHQLQKYGRANAIVIDLAIHYLLKSISDVERLFVLIDLLLDFNGLFIFTCFNGEDVLTLPQKWDVKEDDELKYSIHREEDALNFKTKIKVWHAFSNSYYEEHIVDIKKIVSYFKKKGYTLVNCSSYSALLDVYDGREMSQNDKKYAGLYYFTILKKKHAPLVRGVHAGTRKMKI